MASHGVTRGSSVQAVTAQERRKELQKIKDYKTLVDSLNAKIREHQYNFETLELTSRLLILNPEYYTIWNHRRIIMLSLFSKQNNGNMEENRHQNHQVIPNLISDDLAFLLPLLRKFPKCYWIWNYRFWLLEQSTQFLPLDEARKFWQQELILAGKMLSLDSRNFHGWGYRRKVVGVLESAELQFEGNARSLTEEEFEYTTKMINSNLSNFSAWHARSKLIPRLLAERKAGDEARCRFLDEELELIQRALWAGSEDQSLWFYHHYLMCNFDPKHAAQSMVPQLTNEERSEYIGQEIERVLEMLDGAEHCKWIYQSLIYLSLLYKSFNADWPSQPNVVCKWIDELITLDPLRAGKWRDLRSQL